MVKKNIRIRIRVKITIRCNTDPETGEGQTALVRAVLAAPPGSQHAVHAIALARCQVNLTGRSI